MESASCGSSDYDSDHLYYTPAICRDGFSFRDGKFCVDGDYHQHERADAKELYRLLTYAPPPPLFTKKGTVAKRQPKDTHRDPDASFYTAQMAHYGLKPLKTKEPAKKKLLSAFAAGGDALSVPRHILDLEAALGKEWQEADEERQHRLKVAQEEDAKRRKEWEDLHPTPQYSSHASGIREDPFELVSDDSLIREPSPDLKHESPNSSLRSKIKDLSGEKARKILLNILDSDPRGDEIITTALNARNRPSRVAGREYMSDGTPLNLADWAGRYVVQSKELSENWPDYAQGDVKFEVYPSSTSAHLWASFDFGVISGVMRSIGKPPSAAGEETRVEWRGREAGEDEMSFSSYNCGILQFYGNGIVEANMRGDMCGKFTFSGSFDDKFAQKSDARRKKDVKSWKREWRSINYDNYEVERVARWGKWGGEREDESAFESDTTVGHHKRTEEPHFDSDEELTESYAMAF